MKEAINKIFLSEGFEVFSDFNRLMELLDKEGVQETKIHALCLILYACPSILEVLKQNELSQADGTRIVNMAVNATSLNINYVRQILYETFTCGKNSLYNKRRVTIIRDRSGRQDVKQNYK